MAAPGVRERFWTAPVARALTSPSAIIATGAGAAIGIVATAPLGLLALAGGAIGGAVGLGARLAVAMPRATKASGDAGIDPATVNEPWRHAIVDALQAKGRFRQAVATFPDGQIKVAMAGIGVQIDQAVEACWRIARRGEQVALARSRLHDADARRDLEGLLRSIGDDQPTDVQAATVASLRRQVEASDRLDGIIAETTAELDLLNARLDESVSRAIELSVEPRGDATDLGRQVDQVVDDLEALRAAIEEVDLSSSGPHSIGSTTP